MKENTCSRRFTFTPLATLAAALALTAASQAQRVERIWSPPANGTFYSVQQGGTNAAPLPFLPFSPLVVPVYSHGPIGMYLFDDQNVDYAALAAAEFSAVQGDILITVAGEDEGLGGPGALYTIHWDSANQIFTVRTIPSPPFGSTLFEHSCFAPIDVRSVGP